MQKHTPLMVLNHLEEEDIAHFDHDLLRSIGVAIAKDRLLILSQKNKHLRRQRGRTKVDVLKIAAEAQSTIIERVRMMLVDEMKLLLWIRKSWPLCHRNVLLEEGYLSPTAPPQGSRAVTTTTERTPRGIELLSSAKDILWAALYGSVETNVMIHRVERELLVITIPGSKAHVFNFFQSVTEVGALGTWRDPENRCHDEGEPNMMLQVEYGESSSEVVGDAIMVSIHLINLLEVNEIVLYARSSNIEQSTLFTELYFEKHEAASAMIHECS